MIVKLDHFPRDRGENKKYLSCHHLVIMHLLFYQFNNLITESSVVQPVKLQ